MGPKKNQRSGYYYYMLDVREDFEIRLGYRPSMEELRELAGPGWSALTKEEREPYNAMCKEYKGKLKQEGIEKYNSLGIPFSTLEAEEREKQEEDHIIRRTIESMVDSATIEALREMPFYFTHVNWYYVQYNNNQEYWYCPCEIAIIEFSLLDGITAKYHNILDSGELPLGVRADVKEQASKYHGIDITSIAGKPLPKKERNMQVVFQEVVSFLRRGGTQGKQGREILPPVFTMPNNFNHNHSLTAVKNALDKFSEASHERRDLFRVYPLPQLFFNLKLKCDESFNKEFGTAILVTELQNDPFGAVENLECEFHREFENGRHCSQAIATRWAYTVMDHICSLVGVKLIEGKHSPEGAVPTAAEDGSWYQKMIRNHRNDWKSEEASAADLWIQGVDNLKITKSPHTTHDWKPQPTFDDEQRVRESPRTTQVRKPQLTNEDKQRVKDHLLYQQQRMDEKLKAADEVPLPSVPSWKDAPPSNESDDGWSTVTSSISKRSTQTPRGWNTVAGSGMGTPELFQDMEFPALNSFPDLASARRGAQVRLPRPNPNPSSWEKTSQTKAFKKPIGRGRMFDRFQE